MSSVVATGRRMNGSEILTVRRELGSTRSAPSPDRVNRRPEDAAFLGELQALEREYPNYTLVGTMTGMDRSALPWAGETGKITKEMLTRHIGQLTGPIYYLAGPPAMVAAMHQVLNSAGVDDDDIRSEEFSGY